MVKEANGIITLLEGDADAAISIFDQSKGVWSVEVRFHTGLAQLRAGSRDRAIELANECIALYMWDRLGCDN